MGETISRLFTPPGTNVRGGLPVPATRDDPAVLEAKRNRQLARIAATGFGDRMRLTTPLGMPGSESGSSRRATLVGEVGQ